MNRAKEIKLYNLLCNWLLIVALLFIASCGKSDDDPAEFGSFRVDVVGIEQAILDVLGISITGPGFHRQVATDSTEFSELEFGTYTMTANDIIYDSKLYSPTNDRHVFELDPNDPETTVSIIYAVKEVVLGAMAIEINGLPSQSEPVVSISGPNDYSKIISKNTQLDELITGSYVVEARDVIAIGRIFKAQVLSTPTEIRGNITTTVQINYRSAGIDPDSPVFNLAGTISATQASSVDSDINDQKTLATANNSFATAQLIAAPIEVGGFINAPGFGPEGGLLSIAGDASDYFRVHLNGLESLEFAAYDTDNELQVFLYDDFENLLCSVRTQNGKASLVAPPTEGYYHIQITPPDNGASKYLLSISADDKSKSSCLSPLVLESNFVAGELIVTSTDQHEILQREFTNQRGERVGVFKMAHLDRSLRRLGVDSASLADKAAQWSPKKIAKHKTLLAALAMRAKPGVQLAQPNYIRRPLANPNDPLFGGQWSYPAINLPKAWDITRGSSEVIVAVIDSGVLTEHPDLAGKLIAGYDFVTALERANDGDGIDSDPNDPGANLDPRAATFHGTHVAGIIAAATNNAKGVAGAGWNTRVMPIRALGVAGGTSYDLIQSLRYAAGLSNDSNTVPEKPADIINLSLGGPDHSPIEQATIDAIRSQGILLFAAAGNNANTANFYPGAYNGVIAVSAIDEDNQLASYSNFGPNIDITAPEGMTSTSAEHDGSRLKYGYIYRAGTSMATAHVSAVAALMKALHPQLRPEEFESALVAGELSVDIGDSGRDNLFGHGRIDAQKAVLWARERSAQANQIFVTPNPVQLGAYKPSADIEIVSYNGEPTIQRITSPASWLSAIPLEVNANGLGSYRLIADRRSLAAGTYDTTITVSTDLEDTVVAVQLTIIESKPKAPKSSMMHVLLIDSLDTSQVIRSTLAHDQDGTWGFQFTNVPLGFYYIIAGTDLDNDGNICTQGEACGSYPDIKQPMTVHLDRNLDVKLLLRFLKSPASLSLEAK